MYKVSHERATSLTRELNENNHISALLINLKGVVKNSYETQIRKTIPRNARIAIIIFDVEEQTWWVREEEFSIIKYALENAKTYIESYYISGSISPLGGIRNNSTASGLDGYELYLNFD